MNSEALKEFRQAAYELLTKAKNATFELMDAVMTTRNAACLAEFSLSPLFTRQWSSVYEALQDSRPNRKKLMVLYIKQLEQQIPATEHVLDPSGNLDPILHMGFDRFILPHVFVVFHCSDWDFS